MIDKKQSAESYSVAEFDASSQGSLNVPKNQSIDPDFSMGE